jgi:tetratricopeptide (TPR) repeat protein
MNSRNDGSTFVPEVSRMQSVHEANIWGTSSADTVVVREPPTTTTAAPWAAVAQNCHGKKLSSSCLDKMQPCCHMDIHGSNEAFVGIQSSIDQSVLMTVITADLFAAQNTIIAEAIQLFNDGLSHQMNGDMFMAKQRFEYASNAVRQVLCLLPESSPTVVLELAMRTHNNLGLINYVEFNNEVAIACFEVAVVFAQQLAAQSDDYKLEYATTLSNWCRVACIRGDISDSVYLRLKEIVDIRAAILSWDHPDLAVAYYNVAVVEYSRKSNVEAVSHIVKYLKIASHRSKALKIDDLDKIPAIIFFLLIQNENKEDEISRNIVQMLLTLQIKRQSGDCPVVELAAILNVVGSLLFKQREFENALIFFEEELRLEENAYTDEISLSWEQTTALCVTCNNIGRIMQELGRYQEATEYYKRVLTTEYGNVDDVSPSTIRSSSLRSDSIGVSNASQAPLASANLYSTVWYNYGLVQDKLGHYDKAIRSFQISLKLRQEMLGPDHPDVACLLYNIGVLQMEQKQLDEAYISLRETIRIRQAKGDSQLNDKHIIKALERLASLFEIKGDFTHAIEVLEKVVAIQKASAEFDDVIRSKKVGSTLRCISEMLLSLNKLVPAIEAALESVRYHRVIVQSEETLPCVGTDDVIDRVANIEQFVSTLLLLGSLYYESCEPLQAKIVMNEAASIIQKVNMALCKSNNFEIPVSLLVMREVTSMLAMGCGAPEA